MGRCVLMFRQVLGHTKKAIEFAEVGVSSEEGSVAFGALVLSRLLKRLLCCCKALVHSFNCYSSCCAEHSLNGRLA